MSGCLALRQYLMVFTGGMGCVWCSPSCDRYLAAFMLLLRLKAGGTGGWKPLGWTHVDECAFIISMILRISASIERSWDFRSIFWLSRWSASNTKLQVRSRFFMRHLVAAILLRSRRRRRRSSSSGVSCLRRHYVSQLLTTLIYK